MSKYLIISAPGRDWDFILVSTPTNATTLHTLVPLFLSLLHSNEILYFLVQLWKTAHVIIHLSHQPDKIECWFWSRSILLVIQDRLQAPLRFLPIINTNLAVFEVFEVFEVFYPVLVFEVASKTSKTSAGPPTSPRWSKVGYAPAQSAPWEVISVACVSVCSTR